MKRWKALALLSLAAYLFALLYPGLVPAPGAAWSEHAETLGFDCLIFGWAGLFVDPIMIVAWSANLIYFPLLFLALKKDVKKLSPGIAVLPFLISLSSFGVSQMKNNIESGPMVPVHLGAGAYLWMLSFLLLAPVYVMKQKDGGASA